MGGKPYRGVDLAPINNGAGPFTGREATGFGGECVVLLCFLQREPESRYCTHHKDWSGREASSTTPVLDLLTGDPDV